MSIKSVMLATWIVVLLKISLAFALDKTVCRGNQGNEFIHEPEIQYERLKARFTNCTHVEGNLEVAILDGQDNYDLGFLSTIQEVSGYVLILSVYSHYINLTSLRLIRGRTLYTHGNERYGLYVALNYKKGSPTIGLKELQLVSLSEISRGSVFLYNNNVLCYADTINWDDILVERGAQVYIHKESAPNCEECDSSCAQVVDGGRQRYCWGSGPNMCQKLTRVTCSAQCEGRCYGPRPDQCCHPQCAGGCLNGNATNYGCWACKHFTNEGRCVPFCPQQYIYNSDTYSLEKNPNAKYAYGSLCVDKCPSYLVQDRGVCVKECPAQFSNVDGACVRCDGPCPKVCNGTDNDFIHARNLESFRDCNIVRGNILILQTSFAGDPHRNLAGIGFDDLEILNSIKEIHGYLLIEVTDPRFTDLGFLRNLETIHGQSLTDVGSSFHIYGASLRSLNLVSLKKVENGMILIALNPNLCYVDGIDWSRYTGLTQQRVIVRRNKNAHVCESEGHVCDSQCSDEGCWGPGENNCITS